jgi:diguanylate cyclase (GGDEF)-like protein
VVWNGRDITEAHRLSAELRHQATHDSLTGLANRSLLEQRLLAVPPDAPIAVLLLDLDGFKQVNDVHGHHAGDQVLVAVAERTRAALPPEATVARLGGDEFAVLLPGTGAERATGLAGRIEAAMSDPIAIAGAVVRVGASVGVATGTRADAAVMLRDADAAMYRSKQARRSAMA